MTKDAGVYPCPLNDQTTLTHSVGLSDFDRKHRLVLSYQYELPFFAHARRWRGTAIGNCKNGGVTNAKLIGGSPVFEKSAIEAVKQWRFEPTSRETIEDVVLEFTDR